MIKQTIIAAALTTTFALTAGAAVVEPQAVKVPYSESAANSEQGRTVLVAQLKKAAKQVCGSTFRSDTGSLREVMQNRACYAKSLKKAMSKVGINP